MNTLLNSPCDVLKAGTQALHHQLDQQSAMRRLMAEDLTLSQYAALLQHMWRCYQCLEMALDAFTRSLAQVPLWLNPAVYRRTGDIALDLQALHRPLQAKTHALEPSLRRMGVSSLPEAAGCMYVLGGASMGAQLIARTLQKHLGAAVGTALHFFGPRADAPSFAELRGALNAALHSPGATEVALAKAQEVFCIFVQEFDSLHD